ncbi:MMPL family transporter [Actinomadura rupiterrae]|uniref:MMPL family transporter n=1 Tax=Actinomadura rupiterrae TaxID=559627 RepID=UPI0020A477E8|nr:MMPL family transporter [Actinomadura rupiterrae]MCP2337419.1 RND superfamily putative drug exporter [Actinomadura rupiterrae]
MVLPPSLERRDHQRRDAGSANRAVPGRLAEIVTARRRVVLVVWALLIAGSLMTVPMLLSALGSPSLRVQGSPSAQAAELLRQGFPKWGDEQVVVVFDSDELAADDPSYLRAASAGLRALAAAPGVGGVQILPPSARQNVHHLYALAGLAGDEAARHRALPAEKSALSDSVRRASAGRVSASLVGVSPVFAEVKDADLADLRRAELIAVPLALLVLWVGLRNLAAAAVSLAVAGATTAVGVGMLMLAHLAFGLRLDILVLTVTCSVSLGLGLDYSLLLLLRYRRARADGEPARRAVQSATAMAGRTVVWCGLAVVVTASCTFAVRAELLRTVAVPAILATVTAVAAALTLLPAVLAIIGDRVTTSPRRAGAAHRAAVGEGGWARWARHLMRHPWLYLLLATAALTLCTLPAFGMRLGLDFDRPSFARTDAGRGLALMEGDGTATFTPLLLPHPPGAGPVDTSALLTALRDDPRVTLAVPLDNGRDLTMVTLATSQAADRPAAAALLTDLHRLGARTLPAGQRMLIAGPTALLADLSGEGLGRLWQVGALVVACSLALLVAALRSVLLPVKAVVMNMLAAGAALGLTALAFGGAAVNALLPVAVFTIVFGLSMDYEVFLVHRIAEHYRRHGDNTAAVAHGLQHTARTITLAAAVMIVTFAALLAGHRLELRQIGFATAAAVALDATVIRLMLVPALMQLLGHRNWWLPKPLARLLR